MNNKGKKSIKDSKLYGIILNNLWRFIVLLIIGFLLGYLTTSKSEDGSNYYLFCIVLFFIIGLIVFIVSIIKEYKKQIKREEMRKKLEKE